MLPLFLLPALPQLKLWDFLNQPRCRTQSSRCTRRIFTSPGCRRESPSEGPTVSGRQNCVRSWLPAVRSSLSSKGEHINTHTQQVQQHACEYVHLQIISFINDYLSRCLCKYLIFVFVFRPEYLTEQVKQEMPSIPVCDPGMCQICAGLNVTN